MSFIAKIMRCVILSTAALVCPRAIAEARPKSNPAQHRAGEKILKRLDAILEKADEPASEENEPVLRDKKGDAPGSTRDEKLKSRRRHLNLKEKAGEKILQRLDRLLDQAHDPNASPTPSPVAVVKANVALGNLVPIGGFSPVQPSLNLQISDGSKFAISLGVSIMRGYVGKAAMGAFGATGALHYFSKDSFEGWWAQFGIGLYGVHAKTNSLGIDWNFKFKSPTFISTGGYRFKFDNGLNIGVGAGVMYMDRWNLVPGSQFGGIKPVFTIDFGYMFPL